MPTPSQINQAMQNHRQPPRTHGAMLRDALAHVRQSQNEKTACGGGLLNVLGGTHNAMEVRCDCQRV